MKCLTGHLFDLAPDANSFSKLEGEAVRFLVDDGKVAGVELAAEQYLSAHAAGNSQK